MASDIAERVIEVLGIDKVMILDDSLVITRSYNFSEHAEANGENVPFIESPEIAAAYSRYFKVMFVHYGGSPAGL